MRRVLDECKRASTEFAPDPVHDLRVALRRCRSIADGLRAVDPEPSWKDMKKAGKQLFSSLGELRDVQVMREWVQRLGPTDDPETAALLELLARREAAQKVLAAESLQAFDQRQWRKWSRELPSRAARVTRGGAVFKHLALERWSEAYEQHHRAMRNRSQISFHQLRIRIKRFRYMVENFLPRQHAAWSSDLKELQDLLGEVHDLDVLWATAVAVNAFPSEESRARWQWIVREEREKRIVRYRERMLGPGSLWRVWRAELPEGDQVRAAAMQRLRLWASFLDPDFGHSERVAELAGQLYGGLEALGLGPAGESQNLRAILFAAALMHDVGRARHEKGHHKSSYRLIQKLAPPLGWESEDVQMVAAIARFHRGALPQARHRTLQALPLDLRKPVVHLAGVLRLANALDTGRNDSQRLKVEMERGSLVVRANRFVPFGSVAQNVAAARHVLEVVLRRPILVKPERSGRPHRRGKVNKTTAMPVVRSLRKTA